MNPNSLAVEIEPGMPEAYRLSLLENTTNIEQSRRPSFGKKVKGALLATVVTIGLSTYKDVVFDSDSIAYAEGCLIPDPLGSGELVWYDPCPGSTPTPTQPPQPKPTTPPNSGGAPSPTPTPRPTTPPVTIAWSEQDNDGDGRKNGEDPTPDFADADLDGVERSVDIKDDSTGLGEEGVTILRERGVDVDSGSEIAILNRNIGESVNPEDWDKTVTDFAFFGTVVLEATTTTTSTTTTVTPNTSGTVTDTEPTTTAEQTSDTTVETTENKVVPVANESGTGGGSDKLIDNPFLFVVGIVGGIAAGIGVLAAARRKKDNQSKKGQSPNDFVPSAGN